MLISAPAVVVSTLITIIMALSICSMPSLAFRNRIRRFPPYLVSRALSTLPTSPPQLQSTQIALEEEEANLFQMVRRFCKEKELNVVVRVAGGWVRDKLLKRSNQYDIDLCVDTMTGKDFSKQWFSWININYPSYNIGGVVLQPKADKSKHLETVCAQIGNLSVDIVNLRTEVYSSSSRIPQVNFGSAKEDAERRDLTINSLFYNLMTESIEDFTGKGLADLQAGIIRTPLESLSTLEDDPLRVLRIIRFACVLGFDIAPETLEACRSSIIHELLLRKVSGERIIRELRLSFSAPAVARAIALLHGAGILKLLFQLPAQLLPEPTSLRNTNEWMQKHFHNSRTAVAMISTLPLPPATKLMQRAHFEVSHADYEAVHRVYTFALLTHIPPALDCRMKSPNQHRKPVRLLEAWLRATLKATTKEISATQDIHSASEDIKRLLFDPPRTLDDASHFMRCEPKLSSLLAATHGGKTYYDLTALSVGMVALRTYPHFYPALFLACAEQAAEWAVKRILEKRLVPEAEVWKAVAEATIQMNNIHGIPSSTVEHRLSPIQNICFEEWNSAVKFGEKVLLASAEFAINLSARGGKPVKPLLDGDDIKAVLQRKFVKFPSRLIGDFLTIQSMWQLSNNDGNAKELTDFIRKVQVDESML